MCDLYELTYSTTQSENVAKIRHETVNGNSKCLILHDVRRDLVRSLYKDTYKVVYSSTKQLYLNWFIFCFCPFAMFASFTSNQNILTTSTIEHKEMNHLSRNRRKNQKVHTFFVVTFQFGSNDLTPLSRYSVLHILNDLFP